MLTFLFALAFGSKECAILIDAGSSGSRFYIYSWTAENDSWTDDVPSDLSAEKSYEVEPGIIEYYENTAAMEMEFQAGLDEVIAYVEGEEDRCQNTEDIPIWLMSTAGLRTESNSDVKNILDDIGVWFVANAPFDWKYGRLLSGEEEATYAWIATNYVLDLFGDGEKVGIIEMGGQSFQIAFIPDDGIIMDDSYDLELFGKTYRIYANSWNGFGFEAIWDKLDEIVSTTEGEVFLGWNGTTYTHPCLPKEWTNDLSSKLDWPFGGYYDSINCTILLDYFFDNYSAPDFCDYNECSLAGAYVSDMKNVDFYAVSNFYFAVNALNRIDDSLGFSPSLASLSQAIEEMCELNITELSLQMDDYYPKYDAWRCILSKIIYKTLSLLPNFGVDGTVTYKNAENKNVEGNWLVGMLIESMYRDTADTKITYFSDDSYWLPYFIVILVLLVIALIALCCICLRMRKKTL
jgi:Golgi nucleoside diphosphatase